MSVEVDVNGRCAKTIDWQTWGDYYDNRLEGRFDGRQANCATTSPPVTVTLRGRGGRRSPEMKKVLTAMKSEEDSLTHRIPLNFLPYLGTAFTG